MAIYLLIEKGPKKGEKFKITGGERIGREKGDIVLNDRKVSGVHAVVKRPLMGGTMALVDQKSKNGIIHEGARVDKIRLKEGVLFRIGSNHFRVISEKEATAVDFEVNEEKSTNASIDVLEDEASISEVEPFPSEVLDLKDDLDGETDHLEYDPESEDPFTKGAEEVSLHEDPVTQITRKFEEGDISGLSIDQLTDDLPRRQTNSNQNISVRTLEGDKKKETQNAPPGKKTWSEILEGFSRSKLKLVQDEPIELKALTPRVRLTFFRGPQTETEWELGFGPRTAGRSSLDLPILDNGIPDNKALFQILPSENGPQFATECLDIVNLNGKPQTDVILKSGDIISIQETEIEVNLF